jgi:hypothetical protein
MMTFYHVALASATQSIAEHGLNNALAYESPWGNVDDWDDGAYLWQDLNKAHEYAACLRESGHNVAIYEADVAGLTLRPDRTGTQVVTGAWHVRQVPPERLSLIT